MIKEYGYEFDAVIDEELFNSVKDKTTNSKYQGAYCLRSGRDALKAIAREYKNALVLLPALSCDSMVQPFSIYGHKIAFYKYDNRFRIDIVHLKQLIASDNSKYILLLYMNYFGHQSISNKSLQSLKKNYPNLIFVNDATHTFLHEDVNKRMADYVVVSIRKWIAIPDGGLLWANKELSNAIFGEDTTFYKQRLTAQVMRHNFFLTGDLDLKKEYRYIFSTVSNIIDSDLNPSKMSEYSYELLSRVDFSTLRETREKNASVLIKELSKCENIKLIQKSTKKSNLYIPFVASCRDEKQQLLSSNGIFNTIIWPITTNQKASCSFAAYVEENMLAISCDQRYTQEDMIFVANRICEAFR